MEILLCELQKKPQLVNDKFVLSKNKLKISHKYFMEPKLVQRMDFCIICDLFNTWRLSEP